MEVCNDICSRAIMRYSINFDKTINQLVPHYIGGRKLILFLQSILSPLQTINDTFALWAKETRIEAAMTSQIIKFEWFLNYKFSRYFANPSDRIAIKTTSRLGAELHWENTQAVGVEHQVTRFEGESASREENMILYYPGENEAADNKSFIVSSPEINTAKISKADYLAMVSYQVDKYKLSGKTYSIVFNNETL